MFQVGGSQRNDYSGYERASWEVRTAEKHKSDCLMILSCNTRKSRQEMESKYGVRPCALLDLPYYDPIRHVAIDAMHNLFLGTAKHMFQVWQDMQLISKQNLSLIDELSSKFTTPCNVDRLPLNISSNSSSFTAAQWSTWIKIYSPVVLHGVLPSEHYRSWLLFVRATSILTQRVVRHADIQTADSLLLMFCKSVEHLCGPEYCTANMHLHLHLIDTMLDFGPLYSTWCFSFERYNGMLGSLPTNKKTIEVQFMRRFIKGQHIHSLLSKVNDKELIDLLPKSNISNASSIKSDSDLLHLLELSHGSLDQALSYKHNGYTEFIGSGAECVFNAVEMEDLKHLYVQLNHSTVEYMSPFYKYYGSVSYCGDTLGSTLNSKSSKSSSVIAAYWPTFGSNVNHNLSERSIGQVKYYIHHSVTLKNQSSISETVTFTLAYVQWMEYHHQNSLYGISATVCGDSTKEPSMCSFLPVLRILAKCAVCRTKINDENVVVACPIPLKLSF